MEGHIPTILLECTPPALPQRMEVEQVAPPQQHCGRQLLLEFLEPAPSLTPYCQRIDQHHLQPHLNIFLGDKTIIPPVHIQGYTQVT